MKCLHIELGGKTFPCSNKVVKIKKNKNPIPRWDERLKAFRKKRKKKKDKGSKRESDSSIISEQSAETKAHRRVSHITEECIGIRV